MEATRAAAKAKHVPPKFNSFTEMRQSLSYAARRNPAFQPQEALQSTDHTIGSSSDTGPRLRMPQIRTSATNAVE